MDWVLLNDTDYFLAAQYNTSGTETDVYGVRISRIIYRSILGSDLLI
jgi:hypothetical protein